jgi:hypothetical protein
MTMSWSPSQVQVAVAEHDGLRGPQRGTIEAGEEGFQVLSPDGQRPDGGQEAAGLGGADDHPPVNMSPESVSLALKARPPG